MDQKEKKEKANLIINAQKELIQKITDRLKEEVQKKLLEGIEGTSTEKYIIKKKAEFNALKKKVGQEIKDTRKTAIIALKSDLERLGAHNVKDYSETVKNLYKTLSKNFTYEIDESLKQINFKMRSAVAPDLYKTIATIVRGNAKQDYVIYKNGKHVGLDNYMEMRLRTDINHEISTEMVQINEEIGQVFYICSEHGNCADDHLDYQGKIYCSENWEDTCPDKFHDQVAAYIKANNIMSVEDAMGEKGNYLTTRPNCRHYFQMVSISQVLSLKSEADKKKFKEEQGLSYKTSYKENDYKALQEQRANERAIRKYKRLESAEKASLEHYPTGSVERITIENRRREYAAKKRAFQKKQRELIKKHPSLERDYGREALDRFRKYDPNADGNKMDNNKEGKAFYKEQEPTEKENEFYKIPLHVEVSTDYKSNEYKEQLNKLNLSKEQTNKIYKGIKRIFNNKQAAEREGFYALDLNNLAKKFYNGNGGSTSVIRPKELTQYINEHQDADILTIHNHKGDNLPSPADLLSNSRSNSHKALIIGNSGSIYFIDTKKADYSTLLEKFEFEEYPRGEGKEEKFKQICDKYNVKFVCLRKENEKNENINGGPNKSKN